mmetsp:Transcript_34103/g.98160  ORF Transcript_34103/g.98160 Transcript_34103/m.98160 type:complete len:218 (+) Transcript_34103:1511-2164(+)
MSAGHIDHSRGGHAQPIVLVDADKVPDVCRALLQRPPVPARLAERHVGDLHHLALARIHDLGLCGRDLEELVVEEVAALDPEAAVLRVGQTVLPLWVVVVGVVPPPEGDIGETVRRCSAHAAPEVVPALSAGAVAAVHPIDRALLGGRGRGTRAQDSEHLQVSLRNRLKVEVGGLGHEEGREGQRLPLDIQGVFVARVDQDQECVWHGLQLHPLPHV